jgi:hypothetical protein
MKTDQILINPARAIFLAALLAFPMLSLAQSNAGAFGGRASKPVCVYKGVMSDAEIELCTGFRVQYNYTVDSSRAAAEPSPVAPVRQATNSRRSSYAR